MGAHRLPGAHHALVLQLRLGHLFSHVPLGCTPRRRRGETSSSSRCRFAQVGRRLLERHEEQLRPYCNIASSPSSLTDTAHFRANGASLLDGACPSFGRMTATFTASGMASPNITA